jgi:hypothetical protein
MTPPASSNDNLGADNQKNMVYISNHLFIHLINHNNGQHKETVINSVIELFDHYLDWIRDDQPLSTGKCQKQRYNSTAPKTRAIS